MKKKRTLKVQTRKKIKRSQNFAYRVQIWFIIAGSAAIIRGILRLSLVGPLAKETLAESIEDPSKFEFTFSRTFGYFQAIPVSVLITILFWRPLHVLFPCGRKRSADGPGDSISMTPSEEFEGPEKEKDHRGSFSLNFSQGSSASQDMDVQNRIEPLEMDRQEIKEDSENTENGRENALESHHLFSQKTK